MRSLPDVRCSVVSWDPCLPQFLVSSGMDYSNNVHLLFVRNVKHLKRKSPHQCASGFPVHLGVPSWIPFNLHQNRADFIEEFIAQTLFALLVPIELLRQVRLRLWPDNELIAHPLRDVTRAYTSAQGAP